MVLPSVLGKKCVVAKEARPAFVLATTSVHCYKNWGAGGSRIYKTDCRALLIKLGLGEENTSVREKSVYSKYIRK